MPLKLPAPEAGTDEQAGPKSAAVPAEDAADGADDAIDDAADDAAADGDEEDAAEDDDPLEQAAAPRARPAVTADMARTRMFTVTAPYIYG
jgi:hypothetical protein